MPSTAEQLGKTFFHGTQCNIDSFRAGSHFGGYNAALAAAAAKYYETEQTASYGRIYEVLIEKASQDIFEVADWGFPRAISLLYYLRINFREACEAYHEEALNILNENGRAQAENYAISMLPDISKKIKYKALGYKNLVEDRYDDSICVLDSSCIKIVGAHELSLDEIERGFEYLSGSRKAILSNSHHGLVHLK